MIRRPQGHYPTPTWNLPTVWLSLANSPFEPIDQITLKCLTWKRVFLLAICSANRVHELKAFEVRGELCEFTKRGVTLTTSPSYRPKVVKPENMQGVLHFAPLGVKDPDARDAWEKVCVVRTLKRYEDVTRQICIGTNQLSKHTITQLCVQEVYTLQKLPLPMARAHATRKQSVSWASLKIYVSMPVGHRRMCLPNTID